MTFCLSCLNCRMKSMESKYVGLTMGRGRAVSSICINIFQGVSATLQSSKKACMTMKPCWLAILQTKPSFPSNHSKLNCIPIPIIPSYSHLPGCCHISNCFRSAVSIVCFVLITKHRYWDSCKTSLRIISCCNLMLIVLFYFRLLCWYFFSISWSLPDSAAFDSTQGCFPDFKVLPLEAGFRWWLRVLSSI